jgi:urease accessory protein
MSAVADLTPTPLHGDGEGSSAVGALSGRGDVASAQNPSLRLSKGGGPSFDHPSSRSNLYGLLSLMQLGDSMFPSGAFAHSYGLEQLARERVMVTPDDLRRFVESVLRQTLAPCDAVAALRGFDAAQAKDLASAVDADRALLRTKAASELRAASLATGRRLLDEVAPHVDAPFLHEYTAAIKTDRSLGAQPVAFGVVCAVLGVEDATSVVGALLMLSAAGLLQASMRLLAVSHRDVQAILHRLRLVIAVLAAGVVASGTRPLRSFQPLQDIASMRHEAAAARLFAS